jgi:lambda repressor-like predicted transcriptional regulator
VKTPLPSVGDLLREYERKELIRKEVRKAIVLLESQERDIIGRFYFAGQSFRKIARQTGYTERQVQAVQKQALRKLRRLLAPFVARLYAIETHPETQCVICNSPYRPQIDLLIKYRDRKATWRSILREIRQKFGLAIKTPQTLIGHEKYH